MDDDLQLATGEAVVALGKRVDVLEAKNAKRLTQVLNLQKAVISLQQIIMRERDPSAKAEDLLGDL